MPSVNCPTISKDLLDAIRRWRDFLIKNLYYSLHTAQAYHKDVLTFFDIMIQVKKTPQNMTSCKTYTRDDFRDFLEHRKNNAITHQSMGRNLSAIRSFFKFLKEHFGIENEALSHIRAPKKSKPLPFAISFKDIQIAGSYLKEQSHPLPWVCMRNYALLVLLYGTAMRISEALSLTVSQMDQDIIYIMGKGRKERAIPMLPFVQSALKDYIEQLPFSLKQNDACFRALRGGVLSQREVRLVLEKMRLACMLPEAFTPHALRHSCASHMLSEGSNLKMVQDLLGHQSLSSTERYLDIKFDHLQKIFNKAHPFGNK